MKVKVISTELFSVQGTEFSLSCFPVPFIGEVGAEVELSSLPEDVAKKVQSAYEWAVKRATAREKDAKEASERKAAIAAAKWTVLTGHRSRCAHDDSIYCVITSAGGGTMMNILPGGHDIAREGGRREVVLCATFSELISALGGELKGDAIIAKNRARFIGSAGRTIDFLSRTAGRRLTVK